MSKPNGHASRPTRHRLQIPVSDRQRELLLAAAIKASADVSTWALAFALRAAGGSAAEGDPLILSGKTADRLRAYADGQGISHERALELLLAAGARS